MDGWEAITDMTKRTADFAAWLEKAVAGRYFRYEKINLFKGIFLVTIEDKECILWNDHVITKCKSLAEGIKLFEEEDEANEGNDK